VAPDMAVVSVSITSTKDTPKDAASAGNSAVQSVTEALVAAGANLTTMVKTSGFSVDPNYASGYSYDNRGNAPSNFTYTQTIELTSPPGDLGTYVDAAVEAGESRVSVGRVEFYVSPELARETMDGLRGEAVANAIKSVAVMVGAAGGEVGSPLSLTDNSFPPYVPMAAAPGAYRDGGVYGDSGVEEPVTTVYEGRVEVDAEVRVKMAVCTE
jgi:uncharacterized protein YggE